jgi:hypothetical protein
MREFVGSAANYYFLPVTEGEGDKARRVYQPMAELVFMAMETDYALDDKFRMVKTAQLSTERVHISMDNLGKLTANLTAMYKELSDLAIADEQQRAGTSPDQLSLPLDQPSG